MGIYILKKERIMKNKKQIDAFAVGLFGSWLIITPIFSMLFDKSWEVVAFRFGFTLVFNLVIYGVYRLIKRFIQQKGKL